MTTIAVIGAGGVGGWFGARLGAAAGTDVSLCVRRAFPALRVEVDGVVSDASVDIVVDPDVAPRADWVILATKAHQVPGAASWLERFDDGRATLAVAQNGIDHHERVRSVWKGEVVPVVVRFAAQGRGPGAVSVTSDGSIAVPASPAGRRFGALCTRAGFVVDVEEDFSSILWNKFAYNLTGNTLTTILDVPVRELAATPGVRRLIRGLIEECMQVGRAEGAHMDRDLPEKAIELFGSYTGATSSSMHQDLRRGASIEYEALTGALVRCARRHGIPVPLNSTVLALLEAIDHRLRSTGRHSADSGADSFSA